MLQTVYNFYIFLTITKYKAIHCFEKQKIAYFCKVHDFSFHLSSMNVQHEQ